MKCSGRGAPRRGFEGTVNETFGCPASCLRVDGVHLFVHMIGICRCHMLIKIPSSFEAWTLTWLIVISMFIGMVTVTYFYIRRKMKRKYLLAKIERRRSRRSSEESARNSQQADAFKVT